MAASNKAIVNDFKPLKDGFIKRGGFGVVFKGMQYVANPITNYIWQTIRIN